MDTLPYLSEYILCVAAIFLLYQLVAYLPYGKFSIPDAPYSQYHMIHPGVAFSIPFIVGLLLLAIGWFEDGMFHVDKPRHGRLKQSAKRKRWQRRPRLKPMP